MKQRGIRLGVVRVLGLAVGLATATTARGAPEPASAPAPAPTEAALQACRDRLGPVDSPVGRQVAMCFYEAARRHGGWAEARRELEEHVAARPGSPMLRLALASVLADTGELERAVTLTEGVLRALPDDATVGDRATTIANLGLWLRVLGRFDEADAAFTRLAALGRQSGVLEIEVAAEVELGLGLAQRGGDLSRVRDAYDRLVMRAVERGSYSVGNKALLARAQLAMRQGRWAHARDDFEWARNRARAHGDAYDEAYALVALVNVALSGVDAREQELSPSLRAMVDEARRAAEVAGQPDSLAHLTCLEANLAGTRGRSREAAEGFARCAEAFEGLGMSRRAIDARVFQAVHLVQAGEAGRAEALARREQERARALGLGDLVPWSGYARVVAALADGDVERALAQAEACFDDVERLRARQGDEADRSREVSRISVAYYFVSGSLLREPDPARLELAFQAIERLRARNLLDRLDEAHGLPLDPDDPRDREWQAAMSEIAAIQRALQRPSLGEVERHDALTRLDVLEARERRLRTARVEGLGGLVEPSPRFPRLAEVQAALAPEQALLSYQLADAVDLNGVPEGGSWLWVITRDAVRVHPLPERRRLEARLAFVTGLLARRDGREQVGLAELHRLVLAPALAELPPQVSHLVIVPDGELWSLPFGALPAEPGAAPTIARYSLSFMPSVTSWMRWGEHASDDEVAPGLLALAMPGGVPSEATPWREGTLATGLRLGALPRAGEEVEAITRMWDRGPSRVEVGDDASERFLKGSDLARYGLVHFATHAVMDPDHPERSAVVLAAGGEGEDGLLQAREIVRLPLRGKVVVLSACSGAAGRFVRGEGVMSLARAFLQAGARAVVASRWPLADADAVALFERLYVHVDDGRSLSEALALAQRELHEAGAPPAAWAGVVVLGRGDVVLAPRPAWWPWRRWLAAVAALVAAALGVRLGLRSRPRRRVA